MKKNKDFSLMKDEEEYPKAALTVDIVCLSVWTKTPKVLLIRRKNDPYKGMWALPGGYVDIATGEPTEYAAQRELSEETGVFQPVRELKLFGVYSEANRDPRGRTISIAYYTTVIEANLKLQAADDASEVVWWDVRHVRNLAFDHDKILNDCLDNRLFMNHNGVWSMK